MEEKLIAPCGMNCALCVNYQAGKNDLKRRGLGRSYCDGCLPRGKNCVFMKKNCDLLGQGLIRFYYECVDFPCRRLKALDKRYRTKYYLSMYWKTSALSKSLASRGFWQNKRKSGAVLIAARPSVVIMDCV